MPPCGRACRGVGVGSGMRGGSVFSRGRSSAVSGAYGGGDVSVGAGAVGRAYRDGNAFALSCSRSATGGGDKRWRGALPFPRGGIAHGGCRYGRGGVCGRLAGAFCAWRLRGRLRFAPVVRLRRQRRVLAEASLARRRILGARIDAGAGMRVRLGRGRSLPARLRSVMAGGLGGASLSALGGVCRRVGAPGSLRAVPVSARRRGACRAACRARCGCGRLAGRMLGAWGALRAVWGAAAGGASRAGREPGRQRRGALARSQSRPWGRLGSGASEGDALPPTPPTAPRPW